MIAVISYRNAIHRDTCSEILQQTNKDCAELIHSYMRWRICGSEIWYLQYGGTYKAIAFYN